MIDVASFSDPQFVTDMVTTQLAGMINLHAMARTLRDTKVASKAFFESHGLSAVWVILRDHVLSYHLWVFAGIPALALEALIPAEHVSPTRRTGFWQDYSYPIFGALFAAPFVALFVSGIIGFYKTHLPFLNTALLDGKPMWLQLLGAFLVTDFVLYFSHFLRHKVRWFWYFHAIHHSQEDLNPMTTHRSHVGEAVISSAIRFVPLAFVGGSAITWTVFTVLNGFWGYFIHANVRTNLGPLRYVIVSPQFHRVHHSCLPEHWDTNYGERLILWDWMFGTLHPDFECYPPTGVLSMERWAVETKSGLAGLAAAWFRQFAYPFVAIGKSVAKHVHTWRQDAVAEAPRNAALASSAARSAVNSAASSPAGPSAGIPAYRSSYDRRLEGTETAAALDVPAADRYDSAR